MHPFRCKLARKNRAALIEIIFHRLGAKCFFLGASTHAKVDNEVLPYNIKIILSDLDNTLDSYKILIPSSRVVELKNKLNENNIELVLISNNKEKRIVQISILFKKKKKRKYLLW